MSEEQSRWREDPELDTELRTLLDAGAAELPYPEQLDRLEHRLLPLIGGGGGGGGGGASAAGSAAMVKGIVIVGALAMTAAIGVGAWSATREGAERSSAPSPLLEPAAPLALEPAVPLELGPAAAEPSLDPGEVDPAAVEPAAVELAPEPAVETAPQPATTRAGPGPTSPAPADPAAELALIDAAESARASSPARALSLAEQHARRFPDGTFAQERELIAIDALVRLERLPAARARAARFGARWPGSAHRRRLEVLLGAP